jgi:hypothetical protein
MMVIDGDNNAGFHVFMSLSFLVTDLRRDSGWGSVGFERFRAV